MDKRNFMKVGRYDNCTFHFFLVFWDTLTVPTWTEVMSIRSLRTRRILRLRERTQVYNALATNGSTRERETGKQRKRHLEVSGERQRRVRRRMQKEVESDRDGQMNGEKICRS